MSAGKVTVVVGGQFGSEAKGHVAAYLGQAGQIAAVRVAGPNAGHSAADRNGTMWALRQIPVVAVKNLEAHLILCAGSEIDEEVLLDEIRRLDAAGLQVSRRLHIDGQATVIIEQDRVSESDRGLTLRIGSTGKGVGAARARRIMRESPLWSNLPDEDVEHDYTDTASMLAFWLQAGRDVLIEGTQGYGLGLHAGYYPQCTSSDCRAVDFMAMAGITPWAPWVREVETWVVLRTYPIRVAGNSGPLLNETTWEDLEVGSGGHIHPERTTVTKKIRRVGGWDAGLANRAVMENGGKLAKVALMFFDYWYPELAGETNPQVLGEQHLHSILQVQRDCQAQVGLVGTGPDSMMDLRGLDLDGMMAFKMKDVETRAVNVEA